VPLSAAFAPRVAGPAFAVLALAFAATLLVGCGGGNAKAPAAAPAAPPPPEVGVVTVQPRSIALANELPGRVEPLRIAQVRARVNGIVARRLFNEGSDVRAGQALFAIDAAPYQAAVDSARAALARAEANVAQASAQAERYKPLAEARAVSQQDYVNAVAASKQAEADVAGARASLQTARINLGYASVTAPIGGRIGRALVTEGALVSATEATPLAVIQQIDRVYVNFTQSVNDLQRLRRALADGRLRSAGNGAAAVRILQEDGSEYPQPGRLLFSDLTVDATSGQVTLRAEVPNPGGVLLPGQYVRVRLVQAELPAGMLLPQQAVTRSGNGDSVVVVGADGKTAPRNVKLAGAQDGQWIVVDGLAPGDRVVADGFQKMGPPGSPVRPVPWRAPGASAPASASAAPASAAAAASAASR
jgi:membrane fusion protein (multidrug efflux system)